MAVWIIGCDRGIAPLTNYEQKPEAIPSPFSPLSPVLHNLKRSTWPLLPPLNAHSARIRRHHVRHPPSTAAPERLYPPLSQVKQQLSGLQALDHVSRRRFSFQPIQETSTVIIFAAVFNDQRRQHLSLSGQNRHISGNIG